MEYASKTALLVKGSKMENRAYFFGNMYLSSIQQGIQSAHTLTEMFTKYVNATDWNDHTVQLFEWAKNHKTMVLLNAGYSEEIRSLVELFSNHRNKYPWASFSEGNDALDGALTCVGIILPQKIYDGAKIIREWRPSKGEAHHLSPRDTLEYEGQIVVGPENVFNINVEGLITWEYNGFERKLVQRLNNYGLAK